MFEVSSPLYFVTALTALFESIAMIVDQHQPVVEKYYGEGKMKTVVERLLQECDRVLKSLIESWKEERSVRRKVRRSPDPHVVLLIAFGAAPGYCKCTTTFSCDWS